MRLPRRTLLMPLLLLLAMQPSWAGQRQALVIGNAAYTEGRLRNPSNDASDIAAKLRSLDFKVTELIDADQRRMEDAVRDFTRALGKEGVGLFYFAGHGIEVGGENYLIPLGAGIQSEVDVRYKALSAGYVLESMRAAGNPMNLIILDACRNNPYASSFRTGGSRGLARMSAAKGSLVLYATQPGEVAEDGSGRNGLFTEKLLAALDQPGLKAEEVFKRAAIAVDAASGHKQTPWQEGVILGDFYFREPVQKQETATGNEQKNEFRDCAACPPMIVIPAGRFMMGSDEAEAERSQNEGPRHEVNIARPFALGKFEVTFDEWEACLQDRGCNDYRPEDRGWGRGGRPVIHVSWSDARAYAAWLSRKTGKSYRLPSEAEWEYAARAGTTTPFPFHADVSQPDLNTVCGFANGADRSASAIMDQKRNLDCDDRFANTAPVGSLKPNGFGIHDMAGNVWEWVADCWHDSHEGAPADGAARMGTCEKRAMRGGSWNTIPRAFRSAFRIGIQPGYRDDDAGFRVAREME